MGHAQCQKDSHLDREICDVLIPGFCLTIPSPLSGVRMSDKRGMWDLANWEIIRAANYQSVLISWLKALPRAFSWLKATIAFTFKSLSRLIRYAKQASKHDRYEIGKPMQ